MTRFVTLTFSVLLAFESYSQSLPFSHLHTYKSGIFDNGATEQIAYDRTTDRLYASNRGGNSVDIYSYTDFAKPFKLGSISLTSYFSTVNSVAVYFGIVAVVGSGPIPQLPGRVVFFDKDGNFKAQFTVGSAPKMVTFTPGGNKIIVANEGIPSDDYLSDPWGSVSILDISAGFGFISQSDMKFVFFDRLDTVAYDPMVHIYGNNGNQSPSQDIEPEHIAVTSNSSKAYVSLQENNAIAIIDVATATLDTVVGLGYKDFSAVGLDGSDVSPDIKIAPHYNLYGLYQPDGIATYQAGGSTYILSANEGESRNYPAYSEAIRLKDMIIDIFKFPNWPGVQRDTVLGRLMVTTTLGEENGDSFYDSLFCFGGRSFSIWDENGQLVWDSGDEFEQTLAAMHPSEFNSDNNSNSSRKSRSDDRGAEPENVVVGEVDGKTYAFIALERMGGIMIYDITNPSSPQFVMYELNRDFSKQASDPDAGDLSPEGMVFVKASDNSRGLPLLFVANEVSGTITVYEMGTGVGLHPTQMVDRPSFYPNPSQGVFHTQRYGNFKVFNSVGQLVQTVENENHVDLSCEAPGYYVIRNDEGRAIRVIKR